MRRTASSTASLQHRDTKVAVLNSARLNGEAPHDSRAASPIGGASRDALSPVLSVTARIPGLAPGFLVGDAFEAQERRWPWNSSAAPSDLRAAHLFPYSVKT